MLFGCSEKKVIFFSVKRKYNCHWLLQKEILLLLEMMNLKGLSRLTLVSILLLTLLAGYFLQNLHFDYNFENFFPLEDPDLEFYQEFKSHFESDNDFVLIGIEHKPSVFNASFLTQIDSLTSELKRLEIVENVQSPTEVKQIIMGPLGPIQVPYLHPDKPKRLGSDSNRIYQTDFLIGSLLSSDAQSVALLLQITPNLSKAKSDVVVDKIDAVLSKYDFQNIHVSGRFHGQKYVIEKMQYELAFFMGISLLLLTAFLFFTFRSWWGIWVPLTVVILSVVWLLAIMTLTGKALDIMSILLPVILFVVGMSDVIHIITRYIEELRNGETKIEALKITFKHIGLATFLTSLTTAIGFLTLLTANIMPVKDFGGYTAIGVFLAFILAFTLLPAILYLKKTPEVKTKYLQTLWWTNAMHRLFHWMLQNRKYVAVFFILLTLLSLVGISRIKVDNYLLEDLADDDPHRADFEYFENHFSGVRPFDVAVWTNDSTADFTDYHVLVQLDSLESYLKDHYQIGFIASPLAFVKMMNQAVNGGKVNYYKLPQSEEEYLKIKKYYLQSSKLKAFQSVLSDDRTMARISAKIQDFGGYKMKKLTEQLKAEKSQIIDTEIIDFRLTGMSLLIDKNNESLASNMMFGLLIAFGVIALIMGMLFKSFKMVVITLIPNILPLLFIGGFMGFMGYDLKVSTSIIFTIAFGIAVDDTIHYMSKFRMELNKGRSLIYALKRTSISTGKAITITSIILMSGFVSLIFSTFTSTFYIGLLVSITLLFAVISDLILLPVLILTFYKKGN